MRRIKLDIEESLDVPETITWYCKSCKRNMGFKRKLRGDYLIGYLCRTCFEFVHPITLVISGRIIESKWHRMDVGIVH